MSKDRWRESRPPDCTAEDSHILGRPQSWERKTPHHSRRSTRGLRGRFQTLWASHRGDGGETTLGGAITSVLNTHS